MTDEPKPKYTLADRAHTAWSGASQGRHLARIGFRSSAVARLEPLERITNDPCPRINRLAQDASRDIRTILGISKSEIA